MSTPPNAAPCPSKLRWPRPDCGRRRGPCPGLSGGSCGRTARSKIAPLAVAAFILFVMVVTIGAALPRRMRTLPTLDPAARHLAMVRPFCLAPGPIMAVTFLVGGLLLA